MEIAVIGRPREIEASGISQAIDASFIAPSPATSAANATTSSDPRHDMLR